MRIGGSVGPVVFWLQHTDRRAGLAFLLWIIVELALVEVRQGSLPLRQESRRVDPASCSIGWPNCRSAGELSLVVRIKESQQANQFS